MTTIVLNEDSDGNIILPLGVELCNEMGWQMGDNLIWIDNSDGTFSIKKYEDSDSQRHTL